jgi:hypothetical protein
LAALGVICTPAPISPKAAARSNRCASMPRWRSARASATPPMPAADDTDPKWLAHLESFHLGKGEVG